MEVMSKDTIMANIDCIKETIEMFATVDSGVINDYLAQVVSIQATATETQAACKYHLLSAVNVELDRQAKALKGEKIPPSIAKMRADAMVREWHYLYELIQGLNSDISHTIDAIRTKISYLKIEMQNV